MTAEWKDTTSYSRNSTKRKPTTWTADYGDGLRITVTCGHILYPGSWVMHCHAIGIETKWIPANTLEDAKQFAEGYVRSTLLGYVQALDA